MRKELSIRAKIIKELVQEINQRETIKEKLNEVTAKEEPDFVYTEHFELTKINLEMFSMELLKWKGSNSRKVILHVHGGGYVHGFKNRYRMLAGIYSEIGKGASVLSVDYRVAPEDPFPAAMFDVIDAYEWLLKNGYKPKDIIFAGDSAGGGLIMSVCHNLKDNKRPLPSGIVAMSPWTDLTASGDSYEDNFKTDPVFGNNRDGLIFKNPYYIDSDPSDPYISPLFGDFKGFPPMLIQVGTQEMLLSDSRSVAKKAKEAGVKVRLTEYEGMFHVFQLATTMMPESKRAWVEVGKFLTILERM